MSPIFLMVCRLSTSLDKSFMADGGGGGGVHWAADCTMQWFDILKSLDYNYTFSSLAV